MAGYHSLSELLYGFNKMKKNNDDEVLDAQEAADFFKSHVETIRRLARKGDIPAYKIGRDWRFQRDALLNWAETHHMRQKQHCVLVVDDEQNVRELIADILEPEGYKVLLSSNGSEGMLYLESKAIDLILLDLKMPEMNGPEFLRLCREAYHNLPVIVITGYPDSDLMEEAMRYGPITLVAKPVRRGPLMHVVHTLLNGARATRIG